MKFGFSLLGLSPRWYAETARAVEELCFDSVWVQDHVVFPAELPSTYPYSADGSVGFGPETPLLDPWIALTTIANATTNVRLGSNIYILPLRSPFVTARATVTLDRISGGRLILGAGAGWLEPEYDAIGVPWKGRGKRMNETIEILRRLWTEEIISYEGTHLRFDPVRFEPKPLQKPSIPIHIGGESSAAMRRAARFGDGWIMTHLGSIQEVAERAGTMRALRREYGRSEEPFEISGSVPRSISVETVRGYEAAGIDRVIVDALGSRSLEDVLKVLRQLHSDIIAKI